MRTILPEAPGAKAVRLLSKWIKDGVLSPGSLLPSERQLAHKMEVSLTTVKRAIKMLETEGLIGRRGGRDRVICNQRENSASLLGSSIAIISDSPTPFTFPPFAPDGRRIGSGFLSYIANGAGNAAQASGFHSISLHPKVLLGEELERLLKQGLRGCVVSEVFDQSGKFCKLLELFREAGMPFVVFGDKPEYQNYDRVVSDHEAGGYQLTRFLIEKGCRRILCALFSIESYWVKARYAGYLRAMAEARLEPLPLLEQASMQVETENQEVFFKVKTQYLMGCFHPHFLAGKSLDGILAVNDRNAFEISAACRSLKKPSDPEILITGYDDYFSECWEREFDPAVPVATVDKQNYEMGCELVRLLLDRIHHKLPDGPQVRMVPPILVPLR
jgi:DNA-binding LacI/PurR family transcriptional regulator